MGSSPPTPYRTKQHPAYITGGGAVRSAEVCRGEITEGLELGFILRAVGRGLECIREF